MYGLEPRGVYELESLTAPVLRALIDDGVTTVVVPIGSIEDHGAHLPVGADALLADQVGREVARRLHAVLAPTLRFGHAEEHGHLMSLDERTLAGVAFDLVQSLATQRFRVIALVSTHGGNAGPLRAAVERFGRPGGAVASAPAGDVGPEPGSYSGEWLTSALLALRPELVDIGAADRSLAGELRAASAERGRTHLERFIASIVDQLRAP